MASTDPQHSPSVNKSLMDSGGSDTDESFTLPNNLEHFPVEILMRIFAEVDDIGLLNVSNTCRRFEIIAKIVFAERYGQNYFVMDDESDKQRQKYEELLSRFGSDIKAIKAIDIHGIDGIHWMAEMLQHHTNRLAKLSFLDCTFKNGFDMLAQHMDVTHLTFIGGSCGNRSGQLRLPNYRNLRKFKIDKFWCIEQQSLESIFFRNPQLESLILRSGGTHFKLPKFLEYVHTHLKQLKELYILQNMRYQSDFPSDECIEQFMNVTDNLESLGIIIDSEVIDIFRRLSAKCAKQIKKLELRCAGGRLKADIVKIARTFQNVEILSLPEFIVFDQEDQILSLVERLPKLRHLYISEMGITKTDFILSLLKKCKNVEKLIVVARGRVENAQQFTHHVNANFHRDFLNAKQKANVEIEFREHERTIGRVTETEIIWKNKSVHWIGYDPIYSRSEVNLLDLAKPPLKAANADQPSPFDLILGYLDLTSLYAIYSCNKQGEQSIEQYVQRHSQQQRQFIITDEFHINFNALRLFAPLVNNLEVKLCEIYTNDLVDMIGTNYDNLTKLCFRTRYRIVPEQFIFPRVKHYIFYGYNSKIYPSNDTTCNVKHFINACKDLETLEFRTVVELWPFSPDRSLLNLQTFKFKPCDAHQVVLAEFFFGGNGAEIMILDH